MLVNEWLAQEINARLSVEVSGEPWVLFWSLYGSHGIFARSAPAQWTAILRFIFGAKLEKCQRRLLRYGGYSWT
ncbi:hypothetical protein KCP73_24655 [Salmonella enterica subsp. enterica]|nr:hypothetical protein KCP73_24655 [Salmonella enterica subsp. enterica]